MTAYTWLSIFGYCVAIAIGHWAAWAIAVWWSFMLVVILKTGHEASGVE